MTRLILTSALLLAVLAVFGQPSQRPRASYDEVNMPKLSDQEDFTVTRYGNIPSPGDSRWLIIADTIMHWSDEDAAEMYLYHVNPKGLDLNTLKKNPFETKRELEDHLLLFEKFKDQNTDFIDHILTDTFYIYGFGKFEDYNFEEGSQPVSPFTNKIELLDFTGPILTVTLSLTKLSGFIADDYPMYVYLDMSPEKAEEILVRRTESGKSAYKYRTAYFATKVYFTFQGLMNEYKNWIPVMNLDLPGTIVRIDAYDAVLLSKADDEFYQYFGPSDYLGTAKYIPNYKE